jgi:hypothetical protein
MLQHTRSSIARDRYVSRCIPSTHYRYANRSRVPSWQYLYSSIGTAAVSRSCILQPPPQSWQGRRLHPGPFSLYSLFMLMNDNTNAHASLQFPRGAYRLLTHSSHGRFHIKPSDPKTSSVHILQHFRPRSSQFPRLPSCIDRLMRLDPRPYQSVGQGNEVAEL